MSVPVVLDTPLRSLGDRQSRKLERLAEDEGVNRMCVTGWDTHFGGPVVRPDGFPLARYAIDKRGQLRPVD